MFNYFKRLFKTDKKNINSDSIDVSILFDDLKGQALNIRTKANSNDKILCISIDEKNIELCFDSEQCTLLSFILNEFANTKDLNNTLQILTKD